MFETAHPHEVDHQLGSARHRVFRSFKPRAFSGRRISSDHTILIFFVIFCLLYFCFMYFVCFFSLQFILSSKQILKTCTFSCVSFCFHFIITRKKETLENIYPCHLSIQINLNFRGRLVTVVAGVTVNYGELLFTEVETSY